MPTPRAADRLNPRGATLTAALALALAGPRPRRRAGDAAAGAAGIVLDPAAGVFLALIAVVGLASAAVSPLYLRHAGRSWFSARRSHVWYYAAFNLFWAALIALPLTDNLALAWLLIEATTAASALLVAFSGKRSALEAGWKYVVLTTLGLADRPAGDRRALRRGRRRSGLDGLDWRRSPGSRPGCRRRRRSSPSS